MKKRIPLIGILSLSLLTSCNNNAVDTTPTNPPLTTPEETTPTEPTTTPTTPPEETTPKPTTPNTTPPETTPSSGEPDSGETTIDKTDSQTSSTDSEDSTGTSSGSGTTESGTLTDETLAAYQQGFVVRTQFHRESQSDWGTSESDYFAESRVGTDVVELLTYTGIESWEEVTAEKSPSKAIHYENKDGLATTATIDGSNKVAFESLYLADPLIPDEFSPADWGEGGLELENFFALLDVEDFVSKGEGVYELDKTKVDERVLSMIPHQLYPSGGTTATQAFNWDVTNKVDTFSLTIKDGAITTIDVVLEPETGSYSTITGAITCEVIGFGASVVSKLTPFQENCPEFDELMDTLAEGNWKVSYDYLSEDPWWTQSTHESGIADGTNAEFYEYSGQNVKATHSLFQSAEGSFQNVVPVGEDLYVSGAPIEGTIKKDVLPQFDISGAFVTKTTDGDKDIYTMTYPDFDFLTKPNVGDFYKRDLTGGVQLFQAGTITHDKAQNTVTFFNQFNDTTTYTVVYSDIGKVATPLFADVKTSADDLTWKEVLSMTEEDESEVDSVLESGVLDKIPTLGGNYPIASLDVDTRNSLVEIGYSMESKTESLAALASLKAKFEALSSFKAITLDPDAENTYSFQNESVYRTVKFLDNGVLKNVEGYLTITIEDRYGSEVGITAEYVYVLEDAA